MPQRKIRGFGHGRNIQQDATIEQCRQYYLSKQRRKQNVPYNLYSAPSDFMLECSIHGSGPRSNGDIRHLGNFSTFQYKCPKCGLKEVTLTPDYPYCGANVTWICDKCYSVMNLISKEPIKSMSYKEHLELVLVDLINADAILSKYYGPTTVIRQEIQNKINDTGNKLKELEQREKE